MLKELRYWGDTPTESIEEASRVIGEKFNKEIVGKVDVEIYHLSIRAIEELYQRHSLSSHEAYFELKNFSPCLVDPNQEL